MRRSNLSVGLTAAFVLALAGTPIAFAQDATTPAAQAPAQADITLSNTPAKKQKVDKADRVQQTRDTVKAAKKDKKEDLLLGKDATLPDKQLYDKAVAQIASGHYDVGRLDLQTLLNTYPDSQYQMRAKLAVADAWYKEGGTAALTQAEQEYKDFITGRSSAKSRRSSPPARPALAPSTPATTTGPPPSPVTRPSSTPTPSTATWTTS